MKHSKLTALIFLALILGVIVGHFAPDFAVKMHPLAAIFLRMIKMIIAPLLFSTLVVGIAGHGDAKSMVKIGLKTIIYFEIVFYIKKRLANIHSVKNNYFLYSNYSN